jgi:hypothetical protein
VTWRPRGGPLLVCRMSASSLVLWRQGTVCRRLSALAIAALCCTGAASGAVADEQRESERRGAASANGIRLGRDWLLRRQEPDGRWATNPGVVWGDGLTALCTLAIAGLDDGAEPCRRGVSALLQAKCGGTYSKALRILALRSALHSELLTAGTRDLARRRLAADEAELGSWQSETTLSGCWGYPSHPNIITTGFAVWALADADSSGRRQQMLEAASGGILELQEPASVGEQRPPGAKVSDERGFRYWLEAKTAPNGWRTAASLFVLGLSRRSIEQRNPSAPLLGRISLAHESGERWLARRFRPSIHPDGMSGRDYYGYLLFLDFWRALNASDTWPHRRWRDECVDVVIARQSSSGNWEADLAATAFALLFLRSKDVRPIFGRPSTGPSSTREDGPVVTGR